MVLPVPKVDGGGNKEVGLRKSAGSMMTALGTKKKRERRKDFMTCCQPAGRRQRSETEEENQHE